MFREQVRSLIDRQCRLLSDEANRLGWILAEADPDGPGAGALDLAAARRTCGRVLHRAGALGVETVLARAAALDAALADLERHERVRSWHVVNLMTLHGDLANAVDEIEAEDTSLFSGCAEPTASEVAPPPAFV